MDQHKARDFWKTVVDHRAELCELLDASPTDQGLQEERQRIGRIVQTLRDAATGIDPLPTVEVDQVPAGDSAVLRIDISCNHDHDGIEVMQALVAAASPMPPRIEPAQATATGPVVLGTVTATVGSVSLMAPQLRTGLVLQGSGIATIGLVCAVLLRLQ